MAGVAWKGVKGVGKGVSKTASASMAGIEKIGMAGMETKGKYDEKFNADPELKKKAKKAETPDQDARAAMKARAAAAGGRANQNTECAAPKPASGGGDTAKGFGAKAKAKAKAAKSKAAGITTSEGRADLVSTAKAGVVGTVGAGVAVTKGGLALTNDTLAATTGLTKSTQDKQLDEQKAAAIAAMKEAGIEVDENVGPDGQPLPATDAGKTGGGLGGKMGKMGAGVLAGANAGLAATKAGVGKATGKAGSAEEGVPPPPPEPEPEPQSGRAARATRWSSTKTSDA